MEIYLDMYQTITVAVLVLMLGKILKKKFGILERFCIPAPVIGGVVFAVFTCICYVTGIAEFSFDDILKEVCMVFFFTSACIDFSLTSAILWLLHPLMQVQTAKPSRSIPILRFFI